MAATIQIAVWHRKEFALRREEGGKETKTKETTEKKEIAGHRTPRIGARMAEWHRQLLATRGEEGEEQRKKEETKTPPARR